LVIDAGVTTTTGTHNTLIGVSAGGSHTTGAYNVCVGWQAGFDITTGTRNVCIGRYAQAGGPLTYDRIVMGYEAAGGQDESFLVGRGGTDSQIAFGATSITAPSDIRLKEDIQDEEIGLDFINDLRPVTFLWKKEKDIPSNMRTYKEGSEERVMNGKYNHGFIAQEVKATIDSHGLKEGFEMWSEDDTDGRQRVAPAALISVMVKAVQELSTQVDELKQELNSSKRRIKNGTNSRTSINSSNR
jgi:trimeric autotransporter adhesin